MPVTSRDVLIPLGMICLSLSVLVNRFFAGLRWADFLEGLLLGLALTLSVYCLIARAIEGRRV